MNKCYIELINYSFDFVFTHLNYLERSPIRKIKFQKNFFSWKLMLWGVWHNTLTKQWLELKWSWKLKPKNSRMFFWCFVNQSNFDEAHVLICWRFSALKIFLMFLFSMKHSYLLTAKITSDVIILSWGLWSYISRWNIRLHHKRWLWRCTRYSFNLLLLKFSTSKYAYIKKVWSFKSITSQHGQEHDLCLTILRHHALTS